MRWRQEVEYRPTLFEQSLLNQLRHFLPTHSWLGDIASHRDGQVVDQETKPGTLASQPGGSLSVVPPNLAIPDATMVAKQTVANRIEVARLKLQALIECPQGRDHATSRKAQ